MSYFKTFSTQAVDKKLLPDAELVKLFGIKFPLLVNVNTKKQIMVLVNYNKSVATWYRELRDVLITEKSMPESFKAAGFSAAKWDELEATRDLMDAANKEYSTKSEALSMEYAKSIKILITKREKVVADMPIPIKIANISVNHLDILKQADLATIEDANARSKKAKELVSELQGVLIKKYLNNEDLNFDFNL